jgi:hypothetical protein
MTACGVYGAPLGEKLFFMPLKTTNTNKNGLNGLASLFVPG